MKVTDTRYYRHHSNLSLSGRRTGEPVRSVLWIPKAGASTFLFPLFEALCQKPTLSIIARGQSYSVFQDPHPRDCLRLFFGGKGQRFIASELRLHRPLENFLWFTQAKGARYH